MYSATVSAGARFEVTANAEHIAGSGAGWPYIRVSSEPSNIVFPLLPTSSEAPQYCNPNSCDFGWMRDVDSVSRIMRFQTDAKAPNGQLLLLKIDASNGGRAPWVYVTDITVTVGGVNRPLNVVASPQTIEANKPSTVTVMLSGLSQGDTATVALSGPGVSQMQTTSGTAPMQIQVTPTGSGSIMISATASGYQSGTALITVLPPTPKPLTLTVSPSQVDVGSQVPITINVIGLGQGDTATVTISGAGVSQTVPSVTGSTQTTIAPTEEGQITVTASASGYQPAQPAYITAKGTPPIPPSTWILIGVVVALVAIGIIAVFLLTRRKPTPSAGYKPYYPTAPAAPTLKPGAPQAVKPAAHRPMVVARREEEKK
jgi:hypothetical protein